MNTDETSPFKKLREIAIAINSVDSAKERLVDVISLMSEIIMTVMTVLSIMTIGQHSQY